MWFIVVVVGAVGGARVWMDRWKAHGCDEGTQSHVHIHGGGRCTYCNDSQKCTNEQITLNTLLAFFSFGDETTTTLVEVDVDGLRRNEYRFGVSHVLSPKFCHRAWRRVSCLTCLLFLGELSFMTYVLANIIGF